MISKIYIKDSARFVLNHFSRKSCTFVQCTLLGLILIIAQLEKSQFVNSLDWKDPYMFLSDVFECQSMKGNVQYFLHNFIFHVIIILTNKYWKKNIKIFLISKYRTFMHRGANCKSILFLWAMKKYILHFFIVLETTYCTSL